MFVVYIIVSIIMVFGIIACILSVYYTKKKNNLIIVTVTNIPNDQRLTLLKQTILNSGFQDSDIKVLTTPANSKWTWNERLIVWKNFYKELPPEQLVLSLDAFDVLLFGNKKEIIKKFNSFKADLVFGWTHYCWPAECPICLNYSDKPKFINPHLNSYCFLCAGAYMGKAGYLAKLLEENPWEPNVDDQCYFSGLYENDKEDKIKLDLKNIIFQNTTPTYWNMGILKFSGKKSVRLLNNQLNSMPNVFHFDSYHYSEKDLKLSHDLMTKK